MEGNNTVMESVHSTPVNTLGQHQQRQHQGLRSASLLVAMTASLLLAGCAGPSALDAAATDIDVPQLTAAQQARLQNAGDLDPQWWAQLGSPGLNRIMQDAEIDNLTLQQALLRLQQAQIALESEQSGSWPSVSAKASTSQRTSLDGDSSGVWNSGSSLSLSASYSVDLWGRRATQIDQAELDVVAAQLDLASARITLQTGLVKQYLQWLSSRQRLDLARQNLKASRELEDLVQIRYEAGSESGVAVASQRNTTLSLERSIMSLEQTVVTNERALAVLLGRADLSVPAELYTERFEDIQIPAIARVQPAQLLKQRPDILAAEVTLQQRHQSVYLAEADRWPSLSLSASLSPQDLLNLVDWSFSLGQSLSMTLFDGGATSAAIESAEVNKELARVQYRETVISAMQEVLEALDGVDVEHRRTELAEETLSNNDHLLDVARLLWETGESDFDDLLSSQRSYISAVDSLASQRLTNLQALIELYGALGMAPQSTAR